jgi:hydroxylamine reductase (hybrid-cluster protein)
MVRSRSTNFNIGTLIFNSDELDANGEIPAPFALDENEYDLLAKPNLLPKTTYNKSAIKPPMPKKVKEEKKKGKENESLNSKRMKEDRPMSKQSTISKDKDTRIQKRAKMRPITSDTQRPFTSKKSLRRTMPVSTLFLKI